MGDYLKLGPGFYDWKDLTAHHFDDRIKSIYLPWGYKALLCEHPGLKGHCEWFKYSYGSRGRRRVVAQDCQVGMVKKQNKSRFACIFRSRNHKEVVEV
jgi:hypothetical protein